VIILSQFYTVAYNGENLYNYKMIVEEKTIIENFRKELIEICNNLDIEREKLRDGTLYMGRLQDNHDFVMKYKEDIGYFVLNGERGLFSMQNGLPTLNKEEAKIILLELEFERGGFRHELRLREKFEKDWSQKYTIAYDSRKAAFEYSIKMLELVFNCFPDSIITKYTNYMNRWFESEQWHYDKNKMTFEKREDRGCPPSPVLPIRR